MQKKTYEKPKIKAKKITFQFFYTRRLSPLEDLLLGASGPGGGGGGGCFLPGTRITLADGSTQPIELLTSGAKVMSYNLEKQSTTVSTIAKCIHHSFDKGYVFINGMLKATPDHPIWINNKEWKLAGVIKPGDMMLDTKGELLKITDIQKLTGTYEVFNFEVDEEEHNYFAEGILVHNVAKSFGDTIRKV